MRSRCIALAAASKEVLVDEQSPLSKFVDSCAEHGIDDVEAVWLFMVLETCVMLAVAGVLLGGYAFICWVVQQ